MAQEGKTSSLASLGPVGAPALGVVLAAAFVAAILATGSVSRLTDETRTGAQRINADLARVEATEALGGADTLPAVGSVSRALQAAGAPAAMSGSLDRLNSLPMLWDVVALEPPKDEFAELAGEKDYLDREDFAKTERAQEGGRRGEFESWDRNNDGRISREEWDEPLLSFDEEFDELDKDGDGFLTEADGLSPEWIDVRDLDGSGSVSREEYIRARQQGTITIYEIGPPSGVRAAFDANHMRNVVSWTGAALGAAAPDLAYFIERRAPALKEERGLQYRAALVEHRNRDQAWLARRDRWLDGREPGSEQTRRETIPFGAQDEAYVAASGEARPLPPQDPGEWELITLTPVTGTEFHDTAIRHGVSYLYAVRTATRTRVARGTPIDQAFFPPWRVMERVVQQGTPVFVRNPVRMAMASRAGGGGTINLTTWWGQEGTQPDGSRSTEWFRLTVTETVNAPNTQVGDLYRRSDLLSRNAQLARSDGSAVDNPAALLPSDVSVDFRTGFRFVGSPGAVFLLNREGVGDLELSRETREAPAPAAPGGSNGELEVAVLAATGRRATFQLARWVEADGKWYRVELRATADRGATVGRAVSLAGISSVEGARVLDEEGKVLDAGALRGLQGLNVDLAAGEFAGMSGRTVSVGGRSLDLFGLLYVD
jgi:hypothetical protein